MVADPTISDSVRILCASVLWNFSELGPVPFPTLFSIALSFLFNSDRNRRDVAMNGGIEAVLAVFKEGKPELVKKITGNNPSCFIFSLPYTRLSLLRVFPRVLVGPC